MIYKLRIQIQVGRLYMRFKVQSYNLNDLLIATNHR
jgi:hypothetical protein